MKMNLYELFMRYIRNGERRRNRERRRKMKGDVKNWREIEIREAIETWRDNSKNNRDKKMK
jgi:hypothetical protein